MSTAISHNKIIHNRYPISYLIIKDISNLNHWMKSLFQQLRHNSFKASQIIGESIVQRKKNFCLIQLFEWNPPVTGGFPSQRDSNAKNVSMSWHFHVWRILQDWYCSFNSLTPRRFKVNLRWVIFKLILVVNGWGMCCETALIWMSLDPTYD